MSASISSVVRFSSFSLRELFDAIVLVLAVCLFLLSVVFGMRYCSPRSYPNPDSFITPRCNSPLDDPFCFPFYLSVLAILKNEAPYVAEWIEYHLLVGVDKFWLINNDSTDNVTAVLAPYVAAGLVNYTFWYGLGQQRVIYNHWLPILRGWSYWVAVIDLDEYLVPVEGRSSADILRRFEGSGCVAVNWLVYGTNGQLNKTAGLVIERFRNHSEMDHPVNRHIKQIVNPRWTKKFEIHDHIFWRGGICQDPIGGRYDTGAMFGRPPVHELLRINHYWTKSVQEFLAKRVRGPGASADASYHQLVRSRVASEIASINDTVTDTTIDWAIPLVKANLVARGAGRIMKRHMI
jgi:hypothetical protein